MNQTACRRGLNLSSAVLACGLLAGCHSSDSVTCDRLAAQTSRPGWVVGDSVGLAMAARQQQVAQGRSRSQDRAVAATNSDE